MRDRSVGNGLCAVPQHRVPGFLTGSANTEIVDFDPLWAKIHGTAPRPSPTNHPSVLLWRSSQPVGVGSAARPTEKAATLAARPHVFYSTYDSQYLRQFGSRHCRKSKAFDAHRCPITRVLLDCRRVPATTVCQRRLAAKERTIVRSFLRFCASRWLYNRMIILYNIFEWQRFQFASSYKFYGKEPCFL